MTAYLIILGIVSLFSFGFAAERSMGADKPGLSYLFATICGIQWFAIGLFVGARFLWRLSGYILG